MLVDEIDLNTCGMAGVGDLIDARAASEMVQPRESADQDIVAGSAVEDIVAGAPVQTIGASVAAEVVRMRRADGVLDGGQIINGHSIPGDLGVEVDLNGCAMPRIGDRVVSIAARQCVQSGDPSVQQVIAGAAVERVIACTAVDDIIAVQAVDHISAGRAVQDVCVGSAVDR